MPTLVTGACGFIGSHMVEVLAEAGHEVIAADTPSALEASVHDRSRWPEVCLRAGARTTPLDVRDPANVARAVKGVDLVVHIAAVFDYMASESVLRTVNVEGTRNLFDALVADGSCRRVVNYGAGGIYGYPVPEEGPFSEDSPKRPLNPYLVSKWDQEVLGHSYRDRGIEVTSVRPVTPYGPRATYGSGQLLIGLAERPVAFRNLTGNIPFVHVRDLCRATLHLSGRAEADGEAYNVTDDGRINAVSLTRLIAEETGAKARILPPVPLGLVRRALSTVARIDTARARRKGTRPLLEYDQVQYFGRDFVYTNDKLKATGFEFELPQPEAGLRETLKWYIDQGWVGSPDAKKRGR